MAGLGGGSIASKTSQYTSVSPLGNMGAEAIPSQAEMGIVQSPESHIQGTRRHKKRSCVCWSSGTGHGNRYMVMMGMTSGHVLPPFFYFLLEFRILETEPFLPVSLPTPNSVLRRIYSFPVLPRYGILCICHRLKYL